MTASLLASTLVVRKRIKKVNKFDCKKNVTRDLMNSEELVFCSKEKMHTYTTFIQEEGICG